MEIHFKKTPGCCIMLHARFIPYHNFIKKYHKTPISHRHTLRQKQNRRGLQTVGLQTGRCTKCEDQEKTCLINCNIINSDFFELSATHFGKYINN